jgi:tRNA (cytidine/uridine-2'-O-)-methyltransferase
MAIVLDQGRRASGSGCNARTAWNCLANATGGANNCASVSLTGFARSVAGRCRGSMAAMSELHVVLVAPEIHWNTGNAGRTCLAVGAQLHLVRPLGFSLDDARVRRAGLDYWPRVSPRVWPSWEELERALPELGAPFFFSSSWAGARDFQQVRYPRPAMLIFGRESVGLPPELLGRHREHTVRVPMLDPELRSLNLSTTVGIAAYEVRRQWSLSSSSP